MMTSSESSELVPQLSVAASRRRAPRGLCLLAVGTITATAATSMTIGVYVASPWMIGFGASTLLMWPLGLLLMYLASDRASKQSNPADKVRTDNEGVFETVFDQVAVGIAIIHPQSGRFVRVNGKYESLLGISNEEIRSKTW